jgi:hypothetical protein
LALGYADVDGMLASMTAIQFNEWIEFFEVEPWGFMIEERRAAITPTVMANLKTNPKKRRYKETDFMLDRRTEAEKTAGQIRMLEAQQHASAMMRRAEEMAKTMRGNGSAD